MIAPLRDFILTIYLLFAFCTGLDNLLGVSLAESASTINQALLIVLLASALVVARLDGVTLETVVYGTSPFVLVLLVVALSPLWSDVPDVAMRRVLRFVLELGLLVVIATCYRDPSAALKVVWRAVAIVAVLDIAALALPKVSFSDIGYRGVHSHKNEAGSFALLALPVALAAVVTPTLVRRRLVALLVLAALPVIVMLSQSKTSAVLSVVGLGLAAVALYMARLSSTRLVVVAALFFNASLIGGWLAVARGASLEDLLVATGIDPTLTGRDEVWRYILWMASERPWLGYGYGSFWDTNLTTEEALRDFGITFPFGQGHNGYLDVLIQVGIVGLAAVALMGALCLLLLLARARERGASILIGIATANQLSFWLHNITESTLLRPGTDMWIFFALLALLAAKSGRATDGASVDGS